MITSKEMKEGLQSLYDIFDTIQNVAVVNPESPLKEVLRKDLMDFAIYMANLDGDILPEEAELISDLFDTNVDADGIQRYISKEKIGSKAYKQGIPEIIRATLLLDKTFEDMDVMLDKSLTPVIFDAFQLLGKLVAEADEDTSQDEYDGWNEYIDNLRRYIANNTNQNFLLMKQISRRMIVRICM